MAKWEYKVVGLNLHGEKREKDNEKLLNSLGEKGWELVAVTDTYDQDGIIAYLKREKVQSLFR